MKERIGILGGTFDPIHYGHLVAAQEAYDQLDLERVLFVPAGQPPHKPSGAMTPARHRLRMVELAIADDPRFALSRVDVERPGPSYTVDTLALLRAEWGPKTEFFFLIGSDALAEIVAWRQPQRLIELCELAVLPRLGIELDLPRLEAQIPGLTARLHPLTMPLLEISSHVLRERVRAGRPITYLTPPAVESYIREQGVYGERGGSISPVPKPDEETGTFLHHNLPDHSTLLAGRTPPDQVGFRSRRLQIWYNHTTETWRDPAPHAHQESDECFIVLQGALEIEVDGKRLTVGPREFCCFSRGVFHAIVGVHPPLETLMIRAPSIEDKIYRL